MDDMALETTDVISRTEALKVLEDALREYELPAIFNEVLIRPWMDVANAVLETYGEESDAWRRMIWFSRIVCNAIVASIEQREGQTLERALETCLTWLRVCNQESQSLDLAILTAEYLCRRLNAQMATYIYETSTPGITEDLQDLEDSPELVLEEEPDLQAEGSVESQLEVLSGPSGQTDISEHTDSPMNLEAEATIEEQKSDLTLDDDTGEDQFLTENTGNIIMDVPTLSETFQDALNSEPEKNTHTGESTDQRSATAKPGAGPVPIGVWLGFHDQDTSTMAKLAVYDRGNDRYIFANKQGYLVRELSTPDLLQLIESELVVIIERRLVTRKPA